jgi:NitT/TauT family transport system substrate-binding protein
MFKLTHVRRSAAVAAALLALAAVIPAHADDSITVGKAVATAWTFTPIDIAEQVGILKKHGFDNVKIIAFGGDAKMQQALLAKDIDFGLGSGPGMAFDAKGGAGMAVAAYYGAPINLGVSVPYDSKLTVKDLKGTKLAVSTVGSLTFWLTQRLSSHMGWGIDGIKAVPLGGAEHALSSLDTKQIEGMVTSTELTLLLERQKRLKQIYNFSKLVPHFITHVIFARKDEIKSSPDRVKRFVAAWFDTIGYMEHHRKESSEIAGKVLHEPLDLMEKIYDMEFPGFSRDGKFDPEAVALLKQSFIDQKRLDKKPADSELFTEAFLPAKGTMTN